MSGVATAFGIVMAVTAGLAAAWGAWRWWTVEPDRASWVLIRLSQVVAGVVAVGAGVLYLAGYKPGNGLFWLYALLPVPVSFFAEQLRLTAAQTVLDARGLPDAKAVGALPEEEQSSIVRQILRRELGIMVAASGVVVFLALRLLVEV